MKPKNPLAPWLNKSLLPAHTNLEVKDGLHAQFYEDGQLKHLGVFVNGTSDNGWALELEHGIEQGRAVLINGMGGSADSNVYKNGTSEQFDAWSDNSPARPKPFREWITEWIRDVSGKR